jgi:hypothetical protein
VEEVKGARWVADADHGSGILYRRWISRWGIYWGDGDGTLSSLLLRSLLRNPTLEQRLEHWNPDCLKQMRPARGRADLIQRPR